MKKFLTSLVACMCIICMFSGCVKKKDDASASPTPSTTETEAPTGEPYATPSSGDAIIPDNTPENTGGNTVTNAPNNQTKNPGNATAKPTDAPTVKPTEAGWKKPNPQKITSMQPFANGERVCFVGDSITQANHYLDYIIDYYNNNLKDRKVEFFNCGVSGGKAVFQNRLIYNDTLLYNPTTVVIMLGINDSRLNVYNPQAASDQAFINRTVASYKSEMTTLIETFLKKNIKVVLCTPMLYAEMQKTGTSQNTPGAADVMLNVYGGCVKDLAYTYALPVCDYGAYFKDKIAQNTYYNDDRVHPNEQGHFQMAKCFIQFQGRSFSENYYAKPSYLSTWDSKIHELRSGVYQVECLNIGAENYSNDAQKNIAYMENLANSGKINKGTFMAYRNKKNQEAQLRNAIIDLMHNGKVKP